MKISMVLVLFMLAISLGGVGGCSSEPDETTPKAPPPPTFEELVADFNAGMTKATAQAEQGQTPAWPNALRTEIRLQFDSGSKKRTMRKLADDWSEKLTEKADFHYQQQHFPFSYIIAKNLVDEAIVLNTDNLLAPLILKKVIVQLEKPWLEIKGFIQLDSVRHVNLQAIYVLQNYRKVTGNVTEGDEFAGYKIVNTDGFAEKVDPRSEKVRKFRSIEVIYQRTQKRDTIVSNRPYREPEEEETEE